MWALCTVCILFSRICFDNVQADPYLAYQETALESTRQAEDASAFSAPQKGVPVQQAYISESSGQGSSALAPRKTAQRINPRSNSNHTSGILPEGIFSDILSSGQAPCSFDGLCEVFSNTVIIHYIHRQDGEK